MNNLTKQRVTGETSNTLAPLEIRSQSKQQKRYQMPTIGLLKGGGSGFADRTRSNALDNYKSEKISVRPTYRGTSEHTAAKHSSLLQNHVVDSGTYDSQT